ncbi:alkaline phosphatase family protein [Salinibaculum salinum]|uniref:alkaline phosphatase family protein n=1 Tax=Salinibaculum salinum TaxID=3131996 RepID=UPI0030EDD2BD
MSETEQSPDRAFVLGLDGVPWNYLESWMDAGELENFARLRREGVAGPLASTMPPTTALAWPTIATGVNPDKHGIYAFQRLAGDYSQRMSTSDDMRQPALWDLLSPSVVANVPMTYPASPIDGEMVTGMMTPELNDRFTSPPELRTVIRDRIPEYDIGLTWTEYADEPEQFLADLTALVEARRELLDLLLERNDPRLVFFVFTAPDRLQHLLWDEETMLDHYRLLDEILGDVLDYVEERDSNLFVVSDHGFGPISKNVAVNTVLERAGLLSRRQDTGSRSVLAKAGLRKDTVLSALESVGIDQQTLLKHLPRSFVDRVAQQVPGSHVLYDVDYAETAAFVHGPGGVYVNDTERFEQGTVPPDERDAVAQRVRQVFESVTDPETGENVLRVFDGDDLFPTDDRSPDLVVRAADGYQKITGLKEDVFSDTGATMASHRREGVFLAWGDEIDSAGTVVDASVVDVAPTVLHSIGEPVPATADGRVLDEIFASRSAPAQRAVETAVHGDGEPTTTGTDEDDFGDVEDRLRGLGYME